MQTTVTANTAVWASDGYHGPLQPQEYTLAERFTTTDSEHKHLSGKPFTLLKVIDQPDDLHDECVLPMFLVEVGGEQLEVFADEICVGFMPLA